MKSIDDHRQLTRQWSDIEAQTRRIEALYYHERRHQLLQHKQYSSDVPSRTRVQRKTQSAPQRVLKGMSTQKVGGCQTRVAASSSSSELGGKQSTMAVPSPLPLQAAKYSPQSRKSRENLPLSPVSAKDYNDSKTSDWTKHPHPQLPPPPPSSSTHHFQSSRTHPSHYQYQHQHQYHDRYQCQYTPNQQQQLPPTSSPSSLVTSTSSPSSSPSSLNTSAPASQEMHVHVNGNSNNSNNLSLPQNSNSKGYLPLGAGGIITPQSESIKRFSAPAAGLMGKGYEGSILPNNVERGNIIRKRRHEDEETDATAAIAAALALQTATPSTPFSYSHDRCPSHTDSRYSNPRRRRVLPPLTPASVSRQQPQQQQQGVLPMSLPSSQSTTTSTSTATATLSPGFLSSSQPSTTSTSASTSTSTYNVPDQRPKECSVEEIIAQAEKHGAAVDGLLQLMRSTGGGSCSGGNGGGGEGKREGLPVSNVRGEW